MPPKSAYYRSVIIEEADTVSRAVTAHRHSFRLHFIDFG